MFSLLLGVYEVRKMIHSASVFCLCLLLTTGAFGADTDAVKSVSVTEGDSVHLNTDVTEVQTDDQILWMFGSKETRIAEIHRQNVYTEDSTHIFGDRLQMDSQTGSLTIRNIRTTDSGLYKLQIISNRETLYKRFSVGVYAALSLPVISRDFSQHSQSERSSLSRCSLLCSVVNVGHLTLSWYKGNSLLSSISVSDLSISLSLPLEVEHQEKNTYSCVINNTIRNQTTHLNISQLCAELGERSRLNILIAVIALLLVLVVVSSLMYRHRKHKQSKEVKVQEEEILYARTTFCAYPVKNTGVVEKEQTEYSTVAHFKTEKTPVLKEGSHCVYSCDDERLSGTGIYQE